MYNSIICRYNEIATKGNNRSMFEKTLIKNMRAMLKPDIPDIQFANIRGRILVRKENDVPFSEEDRKLITERLKRCFGLDSFSFCMKGPREFSAILDMISSSAVPVFQKLFDAGAECIRFRTRARRADKTFPMRSREIEIEVATKIEELFGENKVKVDLMDPEVDIGVEIRDNYSSVFLETERAAGGLPVGSNSPLLAMLSGGIDSPVACVMCMKRGCRIDYLTFHSFPYTPMESVEKVARIAYVLNKWQPFGTLFACNIANIQKLIRDNCDPRCRTVLYRRMMMRLAAMLSRKRGYGAIVTGDAVGQVASQTVANMSVINRAVPNLILRPLCGMDKNETIQRARDIGTFDISIEPMIDSCTVFAPSSPVLHSKLEQIEAEEARIPNLDEALRQTFEDIDLVKYDGENYIYDKFFKNNNL